MNTDAELLGQQNAASTTCTATDSQEEQAVSLYLHVQTLSKMTYEAELRREDSLIQQSSHMQTAFSFMTAALFMSAPILIENRGETLSLNFFFVAFSTIILFLLISLVTASLAQRRVLKKAFMSIPEIEKFVSDTYANTLKKSEQLKQWVQVVGDVQVSLQNANDNRVKLIRISMGSFFVSIAFIVLWYLIALSKML
ncbi:MAG: hypothetical protein ACLSU2_09555 [Oscillospiraceae bacterium]|jgi:hypothetical protein